jgi:putative SOS response-associated peptidase YedK
MCTNFIPSQNASWVESHFGVDLPTDFPAESFPGYAAPIIVKSQRSGRVACGLARFGLIPHWAKDATISRHTYNARSETVAEKPSFRTAWKQRQFALLPVENFFEPSYASGRAVRWKISLESGEPFCIACLWDQWRDPESGQQVVSFSMLTINADAHPVMQQFHKPEDEKRTPVIVAAEDHDAWLSADVEQATSWMNTMRMPALIAQACPRGAR